MKGFRTLMWGMSVLVASLAASSARPGVVFTNLYSFVSNGTNAACPRSPLIQAADGNFYGTTHGSMGGGWISPEIANKGIVFKITPAGAFTTLVSFNGTNGANRVMFFATAGLVQGRDGNLYGTTSDGGANDYGTVFKITTNGLLTTLLSFEGCFGTNGWGPAAGLVEGSDGWFYGAAYNGGVRMRSDNVGMGTVYKISTNGAWKTLFYFTGTNGEFPASPLLLGRDGCLFSTTPYGGPGYAKGPPEHGDGTVFKITTNGVLTTLFSFNGTNGARPYAGVIEGTDGNFYGTTKIGGAAGCGTIYRLTTNGLFTSLFSFNGTNGAWPIAALVQGTDGYLYGTTETGALGYNGAPNYGYGTIFRISTNGAFTSLFRFEGTNGIGPVGALAQGQAGNFYGTAAFGGAHNQGTIFRFGIRPGSE